jgi:hypothetical protein
MNSAVFMILAAALSAAALFAVAYPLLARARSAPVEVSSQEQLEELLAQRDNAYQALRELNFDHQVGKITDEDYVAFESNLKVNAADSLRRLDGWEAQADDDLDLALESIIAARKAELGTGRACPQCGRPATAEDKFCASCGASLAAPPLVEPEPVSPQCAQCGRPVSETDRFCPACGQPIAQPVNVLAR